MKILQINNYNYLKGGSEKVYFETIRILEEQGHEVRYFSVEDDESQASCFGRSVKIVPWNQVQGIYGKVKAAGKFIYNRDVARQLEEYICEFRPDVAHLHVFYGRLSNAVIGILRKYHVPMVQSVHEFRMVCPNYTCLDPHFSVCEQCALSWVKWKCVKKCCVKSNRAISAVAAAECWVRDRFFNYQKNISAFIMVSRFIQEKHIQYYPRISSKCYQIYNPVNVDFYRRYVASVQGKGDYYLYLGRLSYEKGVQTLLSFFLLHPELQLKIAGTGPVMMQLQREVEHAGSGNIEFLGFLSGEKLFKTIAHAKYMVIPSEWYENNPLSVIESFALGTPVIGSRIGGIPELVREGENGFLFESKDIVSLGHAVSRAENVSLNEYEKMCRNGVTQAEERYSPSLYYSRLMAVYEQVIKDGRLKY